MSKTAHAIGAHQAVLGPTAAETLDRARSRGAIRRTGLFARAIRIGVLVASDVVALSLAGMVAYLVWAFQVRGQPARVYLELLPLVGLFVLGYAKAGLYPGFGIGAVATLRLLSTWTSFIFVLLAATSFAVRAPHHYARGSFMLAWILALILVPLVRFATLRLVRRVEAWREPVLLVGTGRPVVRTIRALAGAASLGYQPVAVLAPNDDGEITDVQGIPVVGGLEHAYELGARGVRTVFVEPGRDGAETGARVSALQQHFRHVVVLRGLEDVPVEGVVIRDLGGLLGIEFNNRLLLRRNRYVKRGLDLVLGSLGAVAATPLIVLAAIAIKIIDRGPVFFRQDREGLGGRMISVWKLRTMYVDADARLTRHLDSDPAVRAAWEQRFKLENDPRILPVVGGFLRRFSIDELPQLWQVVRGELSLVGPRPFPEYHLESFASDFRALRCRVRPGVTGLWQVMVRSQGGVEEQRIYDTHYIRNWSIWMDLYVLARTLVVIVTGRGAY